MATKAKRPPGHPSPIDTIVGQRTLDDGSTVNVTVADRIIAARRAGSYFEHACASAGVTKETGYEWLRVAGRAKIRAKGRNLDTLDLSDHERRCIQFSDAIEEAEARWVVNTIGLLEAIGQGGLPSVTVTEKAELQTVTRDDGTQVREMVVVERITRTSHTLPNPIVLMWRLEKMYPAEFGNRLEIRRPPGELSPEERAHDLIHGMEGYLADIAAASAAKAT